MSYYIPMQEVQVVVDEQAKERVLAYYQECFNLESAFALANISEDTKYILLDDPTFMSRLTYYKQKETGEMIKKIKECMNSKDERIRLQACDRMSKILDYDKLTTNKQQLVDTTKPSNITIDGESVT